MRDLIGRTLGHYRIIDKLGEGGMGVVYRAHDERLDRNVAVKVLHQDVARDADRLARFEREAKALAALNHPNTATVHGFETVESGTETETGTGGISFLVMELLEGQSLRHDMPSGGMSWHKVVEIGAARSARC